MPSKWKRAPEELTRRFTALLPPHPDVEPRKMFGYAAAFVRGNFWTGLFEDKIVVRLPDGLHLRFPEVADAPAFDPMGGRPMKGWYVIPANVVSDDAALGRFLRDTFAAVRTLPAKVAATRKAAPGKRVAPKKQAAPAGKAASRKQIVPAGKAAPAKRTARKRKTGR